MNVILSNTIGRSSNFLTFDNVNLSSVYTPEDIELETESYSEFRKKYLSKSTMIKSKERTYITRHHFNLENHFGSGSITCTMSYPLKSSK